MFYMPPGRKQRVSARTFAQYATHGVGEVGWGGDDDVNLHLHTWSMLCKSWGGVGWA